MTRFCLASALVILALGAAAPASAGRPTLSEERAATIAAKALATMEAEYNDDAQAYLELQAKDPLVAPDPVALMTTAELDGCDPETRHRALCDYTTVDQAGETCDGTLTVLVKRNGRYIVRWDFDGEECD